MSLICRSALESGTPLGPVFQVGPAGGRCGGSGVLQDHIVSAADGAVSAEEAGVQVGPAGVSALLSAAVAAKEAGVEVGPAGGLAATAAASADATHHR